MWVVFRVPTLHSISLISHILKKSTTFIFQGYNILRGGGGGGGSGFLTFTRNKNAVT
jgi:hypothetical protein